MKKVLGIIFILIFMLMGCSATDQQEIKSMALDLVKTDEVKSIRALESEEGIPLGDLIDAGMGSASFELYDPAEDGETYVTISGNITYNDIPVVAKLQYKRVGEEEYEFYTLVYNDLPRNGFETSAFFEYLYDSYYEELANSEPVAPDTTDDYSDDEYVSIDDIFSMNYGETLDYIEGLYYTEDYWEGAFLVSCEDVTFAFDAQYEIDAYSKMIALFIMDETLEVNGFYIGMSMDQISDILGVNYEFYESEEDGSYYAYLTYDGYEYEFYLDDYGQYTIGVKLAL